jgi:hypothetical protein
MRLTWVFLTVLARVLVLDRLDLSYIFTCTFVCINTVHTITLQYFSHVHTLDCLTLTHMPQLQSASNSSAF